MGGIRLILGAFFLPIILHLVYPFSFDFVLTLFLSLTGLLMLLLIMMLFAKEGTPESTSSKPLSFAWIIGFGISLIAAFFLFMVIVDKFNLG